MLTIFRIALFIQAILSFLAHSGLNFIKKRLNTSEICEKLSNYRLKISILMHFYRLISFQRLSSLC